MDRAGMLTIFLILAALLVPTLAFSQATEYCDVTAAIIDNPSKEHQATQLPAEVGEPVQWVKQVDVQNLYDQAVSELTVSVPDEARNVRALDIREGTGMDVTLDIGEVTITDSLDFNEQKSYLIKYDTPAPEKMETPLEREGETLVKSVIVTSEYHYQDVLTYTDIPELDPSTAKDKVKLYWQVDGAKKDVTDDPEFDLKLYDTNADGNYDRMGWVAPHLSTQIFEVVIFSDADPGIYSNIGLNLLYPSDGEYITSTSRINFNYSVSYNSSTIVYCNLSVDGLVKRENIPTIADTEITTYFNLTSGQHSWAVNCAGSDGMTNTSPTRTFTIDLDQPTVTLGTPDYHVSYTGSTDLNFTPTDTRYPVLVCGLSVNGALNRTGIIASNNTLQTVTLTGLANGVYDWNVSCTDAAGNMGSSDERVFYISAGTPSEYNITPNKQSYSIGETGYLIMGAPAGSNLTMFVDTPLHDSFFNHYNGRTFPFVEMINFSNNAGTYSIDGIFSNGGSMYIVKTSFQVTSSFKADMDTNGTTGEPGDVFSFEANATGGIGAVTYEWDFGDGTVLANGSDVEHSFSKIGEYDVELTATDSRGNKATDTLKINIFDKHDVQIIVKELQTKKPLQNVSVEVDDEKKYTDSSGSVNFTVYEGRRRIYVAQSGYEWVKQVRNITEDIVITIELNNTGITDYMPVDEEAAAETSQQEQDAKAKAELLLSNADIALENLKATDDATKSAIEAFGIEAGLQSARKELRQVIRDIGNAELSRNLTSEEKQERINNIAGGIDKIAETISSIEIQDTTEFVDYPKSSEISMLSEEYLRYRKLEYSEKQKKEYVAANTELQTEVDIKTRLSIASIGLLSGTEKTIAIVTNRMTKSPVDTSDKALLEYIPKEVAKSSSEIKEITRFETVKSDPILKFNAGSSSYSYYIEKELSIEDLKKTKHVLLNEPSEDAKKGLPGVTGFSILPNIKIDNPKLFAEVVIILLLLIAYLLYHFEIIDRIKEWKQQRDQQAIQQSSPSTAPYQADMSYRPESRLDAVIRKVETFVKKEDEALVKELAHIKLMILSAHHHSENRRHDEAHAAYRQINETYKGLSKPAKEEIHSETKHVFNRILLSQINHLLEEAHNHLQNNQHQKAKDHYSEIKQLYTRLEKEHRAAVSERCMKLHEKLFERSLT